MRALWPILVKEMVHILRDSRSLAAALLLPVLMIVMFGYAIRLDVRDVAIAVLDYDHTPASREVVATLTSDGAIRVTRHPASDDELDHLLQRGTVRLGIVIPRGFKEALDGGERAPLQVVVDGTDATFAGLALSQVAGSLSHRAHRDLTLLLRQAGRDELPGLTTTPRVLFNEGLDSRWFVVPGLIAIVIMMLAALLTSQCVAREYEQNTIEQILVSPVAGLALMLGKLLPYVGVGLLQVLTVVLASRFIFGVPIRGSLLLLGVATFLYVTGSMALGLMLSAVLKSQQVAMQVAMVATMLPSLLLSGFTFPLENMPGWLQALSWIIPARYFVNITRGLFLKGVGLDVLWPDVLAMVVYATLMIALATSRFKRSLT